MAFDNTITEHDMDPQTQGFVQSLRSDLGDMEPDLSVDGLSESFLSRIMGLFSGGKS